jgi:hypothetical protein
MSKTNKSSKKSTETEMASKLLYGVTGGTLKGNSAYVSYTTEQTVPELVTKLTDYYGPNITVHSVDSTAPKKHYDAFFKEMGNEDQLVHNGKTFSLYHGVSPSKLSEALAKASGGNVNKFNAAKSNTSSKKKAPVKKATKKADVKKEKESDDDDDDDDDDKPKAKEASPSSSKKAKDSDDSESDSDGSDSENGSDSDSKSESEEKPKPKAKGKGKK